MSGKDPMLEPDDFLNTEIRVGADAPPTKLPAAVSGNDEARFFSGAQLEYLRQRQQLSLGVLGKFFGAGAAAGTNIAGFVIAVSLTVYVVSLLMTGEHLVTVRSGMLAFAGSALGYVFGVSSKN